MDQYCIAFVEFLQAGIVGAKAERLTFEPENPLTKIHQRGLKGQHHLQSSASVVSSLAVVISGEKKHPLRKVSSSLARQMRTTYSPVIRGIKE